MRARMAGAFVLGIAVGMLILGVGLWKVGALRTVLVPSTERLLPPGPGPLDLNLPTQPAPLNPPPSALPQDLAPKTEADRVGTEETGTPALELPVAGISPGSLRDTFRDMRDGHMHEALDIPAARGTPVLAAADGNVVKLFHSKQGGTAVYQFDGSETYCYYYAHLDRYAKGLREGVLLRHGEVLGYVGTTGDAPANMPIYILQSFGWGRKNSGGKARRLILCPWCAVRRSFTGRPSLRISLTSLRDPASFPRWAFERSRWHGGRYACVKVAAIRLAVRISCGSQGATDGPWRERLWRQKPAPLDTFVRMGLDSAS